MTVNTVGFCNVTSCLLVGYRRFGGMLPLSLIIG